VIDSATIIYKCYKLKHIKANYKLSATNLKCGYEVMSYLQNKNKKIKQGIAVNVLLFLLNVEEYGTRYEKTDYLLKIIKIKTTGYLTNKIFVLEVESLILSLYCDQI